MLALKKYMERLEREMGLDAPLESPSEPGKYLFPLTEDINVKLSEDANGINFECSLCPCPGKNQEEFFTHALRGDLFYEGTLGATIGIDGTGKTLMLTRMVDYEVDYDQFKEILEDFCNTAEQWVAEAETFT